MNGEQCHYCRGLADEYDHIVPKAMGGSDEPDNLVPTCKVCNGKKSGRWPTCPCSRCYHAVLLFVMENPEHAIQCVLRQKLADDALVGRRRRTLETALDGVEQAVRKHAASSAALEFVTTLAKETAA